MTVSDSGSPCESRAWSTGTVLERKESRSTSSSSEQGSDPTLECLDSKLLAKGPINLVLKTRFVKASQKMNDLDLHQSQTKSTPRTGSFTTHSSDFVPKVEEEVTLTDDGLVIPKDLEEEEVYKKLSELKIVPSDTVPTFVSTPDRNKNRITPATSTSSSPSHVETTAVDILPSLDNEESSDDGSIVSDISGLTGVCTRISSREVVDDSEVPQEVYNDDEPPVATLPYEETVLTTQSLRKTKGIAKQAPRRMKPSRRVSFSTVCIREYDRILGDNPSCSCGPSISIGWEFEDEEILPVDEWESWREMEREPERLVLCREEREDILLDLGYTHKDIAQAVRDIVKTKNKRRQTIHNLRASGVEELVESAGRKVRSIRKVKNLFGKKKKKKRSDGDDDESLYA